MFRAGLVSGGDTGQRLCTDGTRPRESGGKSAMQRERKKNQRYFEIQDSCLERREVMTSSMGNTFAILPGQIATAGEASVVRVNLTKELFTMPKGKATLGVAVAASQGSTVQPQIAAATDGTNRQIGQSNMAGMQKSEVASAVTTKVAQPTLLNVRLGRRQAASPVNISVKDKAGTSGEYLTGFYLPGDADGDLKVTKKDIDAIKGIIGAKVGETKYNFNADANRDGQISQADLRLAQGNNGVAVKVLPMITARLDPTFDTGADDRITDKRQVQFQGVATPGATVTYSEVDSKTGPTSATSDASGNYVVNVNLADGNNLFRVVAKDAFGQEITGVLSPVTWRADPPAATTTTTGTSDS